MKGLIPIGGRGTRMRPVTFTVNKHFIPVGNKLLIEYPIQTLADAGIKEIGIIYNPGQLEMGNEVLGDGSKWGVRFTFIEQTKPIGLANLVEVSESFVDGEEFVLHLGDNIFPAGIRVLCERFQANKPDGLVGMVHHKENKRLGVPYFDKNKRLVQYVEKPENPPHDLAIPGIYFFSAKVFECFKGAGKIKASARGEYEISAPYQWMIDHGYKIEVEEIEGDWLDPGKFDDWITSNAYLLDKNTQLDIQGQVDAESKISGRVRLGKGSKLINTVVRGPVDIGEKVVVENSFIGPFTSIYHGCEIKGSRIENSVLMGKARVSNMPKTIDSSILGESCRVEGKHEQVELFLGQMSELKV